MSYWAWLSRMIFFGALGGASLLFWLRTPPSETQSQDPSPMPQAQIVPFDVASSFSHTPSPSRIVDGQLPPIPKSRLAPLQTTNAPTSSGQLPERTATLPPPADPPAKPSPASTPQASPSPSPTPQTTPSQPPTSQPKASQPKASQPKTSQPKAEPTTKPTPPPPLPPAPTSASSNSAPPKSTPSRSAPSPAPQPQQPKPFDMNTGVTRYAKLFETPISLGMLAIGVAEGNYRVFIENGSLYVEQTSLYFGHTDPGNLSWGERVTNYGPCSDQNRSGGDIKQAEQMCLKRARDRLPTNLQDLVSAGINPDMDLEAVINTADLYNQASPVHSRLFPQALRIAYEGGLTGVEAMAWARTASFYVDSNKRLDIENGRNVASGLLGICSRERRPVTEWECVYADQLRRSRAVADVLDKYFQANQAS